jgi:hypothetical protein
MPNGECRMPNGECRMLPILELKPPTEISLGSLGADAVGLLTLTPSLSPLSPLRGVSFRRRW